MLSYLRVSPVVTRTGTRRALTHTITISGQFLVEFGMIPTIGRRRLLLLMAGASLGLAARSGSQRGAPATPAAPAKQAAAPKPAAQPAVAASPPAGADASPV